MALMMNSNDTTSWPSQRVSSIVARVGPSNFDGNQRLDRRIAVASMMDWTDAGNFPRGIMCLGRRETPNPTRTRDSSKRSELGRDSGKGLDDDASE